MKTIFMFPGQGAQQVGMGKELIAQHPELRQTFDQAADILGYDLASLCFDGPEEKLNNTEISQPAIFVTSVVCLEALKVGLLGESLTDVKPDGYAGLSLGEYTALYAAGTLDFEQGLRLVQVRGESMQAAADQRHGTMVSILGIDEQQALQLTAAVLAENIAEDDGLPTVLAPVNFNCPGQIVFSGTLNACKRAAELAPDHGAGRTVELAVAGAFHTELMQPAADRLQKALAEVTFGAFVAPVIANVDAQPYAGPDEIPGKLMQQLVQPVRWQQSIERLLDEGIERFVEIGPGRVLTGLTKKIARAQKAKPEIETITA